MEFKDKLLNKRTELELTLQEVADYVGVSKTTVQRWESGNIANLKRDKIAKLAGVLKVTPGYLMGWDESKVNAIPLGAIHNIKVIGRVCAGIGGIAQLEPLGYEVATDLRNPDEYVYLKVKGNSMYPNIMDGDLALVHMQPDIESGELGVVVIDGEEGVIKKIQKHEGAVSLVSFNPEYPPRLIMGAQLKEFYVFGKVVKTVRNY